MKEEIMRFVAKFLHHSRDKSNPPDFGVRVLLHIPIGFITGIAVLGHWILPLTLTAVFLYYEHNEDAHTKDEAWKDTFGFMVGLVMAIFTVMGLELK